MTEDATALPGFRELALDLEARFRRPSAWTATDFDRLALRAFRLQARLNRPYGAFCRARGVDPAEVRAWREIPPVPVAAFRDVPLTVGGTGREERVFRTSGTTGGRGRRGEHHVARLSLYHASVREPARRFLFAGRARRVLSLVPSPELWPDSSLAEMVRVLGEEVGRGTTWLADGEGVVDSGALFEAVRRCAGEEDGVLLVGTAFALLHVVRTMEERDERVHLPEGSVVMETGGFKGRVTEVSREDLHRALTARLGVQPERIVGEYGMTELFSQLYEPVLEEGPAARGWYVAPPWLRVRALDAASLQPVEEGARGLLAFFDLANLGSVCHVLTADVGVVQGGRVRLEGRLPGALPRGCSLAVEDLLRAGAEP